MTPTRVVLDTNVVVSALVFRGSLAWYRQAWTEGPLRPLASRATALELIRALAYPKFRLNAAARRELIHDWFPYCEAVRIPIPPPATPKCRDPADQSFLELAIAGKADALVSGDADLLALGDVFSVPIRSPGAFRARMDPRR